MPMPTQNARRYKKRIAKARKKQNLCVVCGKRPPEEGKVGCSVCYKRHATHQVMMTKDLKALGFCIQCRGGIPEINPKTGKKYARCAQCRKYQNSRCMGYHTTRKAKMEAQGGCLDCGKEVTQVNPTTGKPFKRCRPCRLSRSSLGRKEKAA